MVRNILREPDVLKTMGISKRKLWYDVGEGKFPAPVKLGERAIGWFEDEIAAYQEKLTRVAVRPMERGAA
jgi:prophage regulatory protein